MSSLVIIGIVVAVLLVIAIVMMIILLKSKKKEKEVPASILDVQNIGVSTGNQEFSYGYEKEETIVMDPVNVETESTDTQVDEKPSEENNEKNKASTGEVLNVSTEDVVNGVENIAVETEEIIEEVEEEEEPIIEDNSNTQTIVESISEDEII